MVTEKEIRVIVTVPNQKVITVKHDICDKTHLYTKCNIAANNMAMKELSANAYKLYMYFNLNQNNYTLALSYVAVHNLTNMADKTYQRAVKELIEKGYLVKEKDKKNAYIFYEGKENGVDGTVETTGQESTTGQDDGQNVPTSTGKNDLSRPPKTTGEILQDNIKYNNDIETAPDTSGAEVADAQFEFDCKCFSNEDVKRIMKATYNEELENTRIKDMVQYLVDTFTGNLYKCNNAEAVRSYATYIVSN